MLVCLVLLLAIAATAPPDGTVCIAPLPEHAAAVDHEYPGGKAPREFRYQFTVQLDGQRPVSLPASEPLARHVPLKGKHRIVIRDAGTVIESFDFTFASRHSTNLCLSYGPWYQAWSLEAPGRRPWCRCKKGSSPPN